MAQAFLDSKNGWTDPVSTTASMMYLRDDDKWHFADDIHKFLSSKTGAWETPVIDPTMSPLAFNLASWRTLAKTSADCASKGSSAYEKMLGWTKDIIIMDEFVVKARLIGLCHDTLTAGGTAGFTFQLWDGLSSYKPTEFRMNATDSNTGGWASSDMRGTNLPKMLEVLPDDLQASIKKVDKVSGTVEIGASVTTTSDDLFLLSLVESIGTSAGIYPTNPLTSENFFSKEGSQYEYFRKFESDQAAAVASHTCKDGRGVLASVGRAPWRNGRRLSLRSSIRRAPSTTTWRPPPAFPPLGSASELRITPCAPSRALTIQPRERTQEPHRTRWYLPREYATLCSGVLLEANSVRRKQ